MAFFTKKIVCGMLPVACLICASIIPRISIANTQCETSVCNHMAEDRGNESISHTQNMSDKMQWHDSTIQRKQQDAQGEPSHHSAGDNKLQCLSSRNAHAYWESRTKRCLDRRTGNQVVWQ
jgi:hypothetical protein